MRRGIAAIVYLIPLVAVAFAAASCAPAPPGQITAARGVLVNLANQPLGSAQIRFFAANQNPRSQIWRKTARALISVSTDSMGAFDFSTITPGTYFLEVRAANVKQTLLATIMPRSKDAAQEIRVRLLETECKNFEVTTN
jgi:hypothetical protein